MPGSRIDRLAAEKRFVRGEWGRDGRICAVQMRPPGESYYEVERNADEARLNALVAQLEAQGWQVVDRKGDPEGVTYMLERETPA